MESCKSIKKKESTKNEPIVLIEELVAKQIHKAQEKTDKKLETRIKFDSILSKFD